jgi:hypothetical protein
LPISLLTDGGTHAVTSINAAHAARTGFPTIDSSLCAARDRAEPGTMNGPAQPGEPLARISDP